MTTHPNCLFVCLFSHTFSWIRCAILNNLYYIVDNNRDEVSQIKAGKTRMEKVRNEEIRRRVDMQPAEQTRSGVDHTSRGWHQRLPRLKHSWSSPLQKTTKGKATKSLGRRCTEMVQCDWNPDDMSTTGWWTDVRLYIHSTPMAENFD